jgi:hypothetical protein
VIGFVPTLANGFDYSIIADVAIMILYGYIGEGAESGEWSYA